MTTLVCADIHMDTKEEERWGLFTWLINQGAKHNAEEVVIAGDGTVAKDRHNSMLVNRMVDEIAALSEEMDVYWLAGNHDYLDKNEPFFKFLSKLPKVHFITDPWPALLTIGPTIMLPSTANWKEDWQGLDFSRFDYAFAHQTFSGATTETGFKLIEGVPPTTLDGVRIKAYSGDIHVPQKFGKKGEYIGAPYRTKYGDTYEGRCLLIENKNKQHRQTDLHFPMTASKHVIEMRDIDDLKSHPAPKGSSVKIRVKVSTADLPVWQETKAKARAEAERLGWAVHDVELVRTDVAGRTEGIIRSRATSAVKIFDDYCKAKVAPVETIDAGRAILKKLGAR